MPFVQKLKRLSWQGGYMAVIWRIIQSSVNYQLVSASQIFLEWPMGSDLSIILGFDGFTTLSTSVFCWLINIRPRYLLFLQGNICTIEPYMPSRFARQFGYDQLYVRNPNPGLHSSGNLYERAQAWHYSQMEVQMQHLSYHRGHPTSIRLSASAHGTP